MYFELENSSGGQYFFRIKSSGNYKTLCHSETYVSKNDAENAIDLIKEGAANAEIIDNT